MVTVQWCLVIAAVFAGAGILMQLYFRTRERADIRRELRSGLTPPNGSTPPEYRVPVPWIHATQTGISEIMVDMHKNNDQTLAALRRIEDILVGLRDGDQDDTEA